MDFDPTASWRSLQELCERTEHPRHRQLLTVVIDHIKAEVDRDIDAVFATLVADPNFHIWVSGRDVGAKGRSAVWAYYEAFLNGGGAVFESIKDRIVVNDDTIAHEGPVRNLVSATIARRRGYTVPDEDGHVVVRFRNVVWWSFDPEGLAYGEDSYTTFHPDDWERVAEADLPECYTSYLRAIAAR